MGKKSKSLKYCRLCLATDRHFSSVFEEKDEGKPVEVISKILSIEIRETDFFSKLICKACLKLLFGAHELQRITNETQKHLLLNHEKYAQYPAKRKPGRQRTSDLSSEVNIKEEILEDDEEDEIIPYEPMDVEELVEESDQVEDEESDQVEDDESDQVEDSNAPLPDTIDTDIKEAADDDKEEELLVEQKKGRGRPSGFTNVKRDKNKEFLCNVCRKVFQAKASLAAHFTKEHNDIKRPHKCNRCYNQFRIVPELKAHRKIHEMDKDASKQFEEGDADKLRRCAVCKKKLNLENLEKHWDLRHNPVLNPFSCAYCRYRTQSEKLIFKHVEQLHNALSEDPKNDLKMVLIRPRAIKIGSVPSKMAIFVNPVLEEKNSEIEKHKIKLEIARLERERTAAKVKRELAKEGAKLRREQSDLNPWNNRKKITKRLASYDDDEVVVYDVEPESDPLQQNDDDDLISEITTFKEEIID